MAARTEPTGAPPALPFAGASTATLVGVPQKPASMGTSVKVASFAPIKPGGAPMTSYKPPYYGTPTAAVPTTGQIWPVGRPGS